MARISATDVQKREQFLLKQFRENPKLSAHAANDLLAKEFGKKMRPTRVFELKRTVKKASTGAGEAGTNGPAAGRGARKAKRGARRSARRNVRRGRPAANVSPEVREEVNRILTKQDFVVLTGTKEEMSTVRRILGVLKDNGAAVNVDESLAKTLKGLTEAGLGN